MQNKLAIYLFIFLFALGIFAGLFPYPIFSDYTNVTSQNMLEISNLSESELSTSKNIEQKVVCLDWSVADLLFEYDTTYVLTDLETGVDILIQRTGGTSHAEVETINESNTQKFLDVVEEYSWQRRPCLLQLNDNLFISVSISCYPHGDNQLNNGLGGHLCLHFKNSKTHGTNIVDKAHQKAIKIAQKTGLN